MCLPVIWKLRSLSVFPTDFADNFFSQSFGVWLKEVFSFLRRLNCILIQKKFLVQMLLEIVKLVVVEHFRDFLSKTWKFRSASHTQFTVFFNITCSVFKPSCKHVFQKHLVTAAQLEIFSLYLWSSSIPSKTAVFTCKKWEWCLEQNNISKISKKT